MAQLLTPGRSAVAAAVVTLACGSLALNRHLVGVFYDDGLYAGLGWALGHGLGYVHPNLPGAPSAVHYPPLYPLTLAPLFALLPVPAAALAGKLFNLLCAGAATGLVAWHAARRELLGPGAPSWLPATAVVAGAVAIPCLAVLTVLFSEPAFALLLAVAIILADDVVRQRVPDRVAVAAGLLTALAFLTRSLGVAAGAGVIGWMYVAARAEGAISAVRWRRVALAAAPLVVAGASWGVWIRTRQGGLDPLLASDYGSYFDIARNAGATAVVSRVLDLTRPLGVLVLSWVPASGLYYALGVPAVAVGLYGLARLCRRSAVGVTLVVYLAILACWPVPPDRFLWAVLPWLALAWASGAVGLWSLGWPRVPVAVLTVALVAGYARYEVKGVAGRWWDLASARISSTFEPVLPAVDSLPPDAVLAADHEPLVWLYTRRSAVPFYIYSFHGRDVLEPPPDVHRAYLERQGVTHLLLTGEEPGAAHELQRLQDAYPGWLEVERRWPGGQSLLAVRHVR